jgi:hypothetical protein
MLRRRRGFYIVVPRGVYFPMQDYQRSTDVSCFMSLAGFSRLTRLDHLTQETVRDVFRDHRVIFEKLASSLHDAQVNPDPN